MIPSPFKLGYYYDPKRDRADKKSPLRYEGERHILLFGVNGAGKSTKILVENIATSESRSLVIFDMKGELTAQTIRARSKKYPCAIVNPYNLHDLGSNGFNPLSTLDPDDKDTFFDRAKQLTVAIIEVSSDKESGSFFSQSAQGWLCCGIMQEVLAARVEARPPSLLKARQWCLQPDVWQKTDDGRETLISSVSINARVASSMGDETISGLASRFASEGASKSKSLQDVLNTLATETEFLVSPAIARDLEKDEWDFDQLKHEPSTVYIILPPEEISDKRRWTRLLITCALIAHLKKGPVSTLFILDEFRVSIGHLQIVNEFWSLVRGYGVQFMPVCQSVLQLKALFKEEWENYAGQAGVVATLGPPGDMETAQWMSRRSGNMTVWQQGFNEGEGQSGSGRSRNLGESRSQVERPFLLPQELLSIPTGTGILWMAGEGNRSIPFYAPNYWQIAALEPLIDPSPLHNGPLRFLRLTLTEKIIERLKEEFKNPGADARESIISFLQFLGVVFVVGTSVLLNADNYNEFCLSLQAKAPWLTKLILHPLFIYIGWIGSALTWLGVPSRWQEAPGDLLRALLGLPPGD